MSYSDILKPRRDVLSEEGIEGIIDLANLDDRRRRKLEARPADFFTFIKKESPPKPMEFDILAAATQDGQLSLKWYRTPGLGDARRGCQVAEVWLIKQQPPLSARFAVVKKRWLQDTSQPLTPP